MVRIFIFNGHTYIGVLKEEKADVYVATGVIQLLPTPEGKIAGVGFGFDLAEFNGEVIFPKESTAMATPKLEAIKIYDNIGAKMKVGSVISQNNLTYGGNLNY